MKKNDVPVENRAEKEAQPLEPSDVAAERAIYAAKRDTRSSWLDIVARSLDEATYEQRTTYSG